MDANTFAPSQRSQQEQVLARLLEELRFDDDAFSPDRFDAEADEWALSEPKDAHLQAPSALDAADRAWIVDIAALMTPERAPVPVASAQAASARAPLAAGVRVVRAAPSPRAAPQGVPGAAPRTPATDQAPAAPAARRDGRRDAWTEPFEFVTRDGVRFGRFPDGVELQYDGIDERGQPNFLRPRDSVPVAATSFALPIVVLGLLAAAVLNLHTALGVLSAFLPSILPAIAPTFRL